MSRRRCAGRSSEARSVFNALGAGDDPDLAAVGAAGFLGDHGQAFGALGAPDLAVAGDIVSDRPTVFGPAGIVSSAGAETAAGTPNEAKAAPEGGTTAIAVKAAATTRKNMIIG